MIFRRCLFSIASRIYKKINLLVKHICSMLHIVKQFLYITTIIIVNEGRISRVYKFRKQVKRTCIHGTYRHLRRIYSSVSG